MLHENSDTQAAIDAGAAIGEPKTLVSEHVSVMVLPHGAQLKEFDLEKYRDTPLRKRGTYLLDDAPSFIDYVNREKTPTSTTWLFAKKGSQPSFTCAFNGNECEIIDGERGGGVPQPGWGDYKAHYACPLSPEWKTWSEKDGVKMTQADFAEFIEENLPDIIVPPTGGGDNSPMPGIPTPQAMLEVSRGLDAKRDVAFTSAIRLSNGSVQFKYDETVSGYVQGGTLSVPERFAIGVPVFEGTDPWVIFAKLRYRIDKGGLCMWYDLERTHKVLERAFDETRAQIEKGTGLKAILGARA